MREDFPEYSYDDIYIEIYGNGEKSSVGVKRMISNRLKKLPSLSDQEQTKIIDEIKELVWHLYSRYREGQKKLDSIRGIIER